MRERSMTRAMAAGFIATLVMTLLGIAAVKFGVPTFNWADTLRAWFGGGAMAGYALFFIFGIALAMIYVAVFHDRLPGYSWRRGMFFAAILWVLTGLAISPYVGLGFFMGSVAMAMATLALYMLYGAILGWIYDA